MTTFLLGPWSSRMQSPPSCAIRLEGSCIGSDHLSHNRPGWHPIVKRLPFGKLCRVSQGPCGPIVPSEPGGQASLHRVRALGTQARRRAPQASCFTARGDSQSACGLGNNTAGGLRGGLISCLTRQLSRQLGGGSGWNRLPGRGTTLRATKVLRREDGFLLAGGVVVADPCFRPLRPVVPQGRVVGAIVTLDLHVAGNRYRSRRDKAAGALAEDPVAPPDRVEVAGFDPPLALVRVPLHAPPPDFLEDPVVYLGEGPLRVAMPVVHCPPAYNEVELFDEVL